MEEEEGGKGGTGAELRSLSMGGNSERKGESYFNDIARLQYHLGRVLSVGKEVGC